jgi:deoxynucleoside triphosphate triphosphohydrolase SAMHD1
MRRVRKRDLYRLVDKAFISWDDRHLWSQRLTPESIVEAAKNLKVPEVDGTDVQQRISELTVEHVIVEMSGLHHGMGDKFPLDNCKFYGKYSPNSMISVISV